MITFYDEESGDGFGNGDLNPAWIGNGYGCGDMYGYETGDGSFGSLMINDYYINTGCGDGDLDGNGEDTNWIYLDED